MTDAATDPPEPWKRGLVLTAPVLLLGDKSHPGGDLTVVSHNVGADNPDPARTALDLAASRADVLALQEFTPQAGRTYERELAKAYPHHTVRGTVGLWSELPLSDTRPVDIKTDYGPLADTEPDERVVLLGDLNGTLDDRAFAGITSRLHSAQEAAGGGRNRLVNPAHARLSGAGAARSSPMSRFQRRPVCAELSVIAGQARGISSEGWGPPHSLLAPPLTRARPALWSRPQKV